MIIRLSTIAGLLVLLNGCASPPQIMQSCRPHSPAPSEQSWTNEEISASAGHFRTSFKESSGQNEAVMFRVSIKEPANHRTWSSSAAICVVGQNPSEKACVHYVYDSETKVLKPTYSQGAALAGGKSSADMASATIEAGAEIHLRLKLDSDQYSVRLCDGQEVGSRTGFKIKGYELMCVGATCSFASAK